MTFPAGSTPALESDSTSRTVARRLVAEDRNATETRQIGRRPGELRRRAVLLSGLAVGMACGVAQGQGVSATVPAGPSPVAVAVNETSNMVYETDQTKIVTAINGVTNAPTTIQAGGPGTDGVVVNPTTNTIYVLNDGSQSSSAPITVTPGSVVVINGATNAVTTTIALPALGAHIALNPVTNQVYVSTLSAVGNGAVANIAVIDGATNAITATIPIPELVSEVAVDSTRNLIYVTHINPPGNGTLVVIDGATNTVKTTIALGYNDNTFVINQATNTLYVPDAHGNQIDVIDGATDTITTTVPISSPLQLGVNAVTNKVYVLAYNTGNGSSEVQVLDGATNTFTGTITFSAGSPFSAQVLVNAAANTVWVTTTPVVVVDGSTGTATSVTGTSGITINSAALNTKTNYAYVAEANNVLVINGAPNGPAFSASPSPLAFGNQTQDSTSNPMTLTVTNSGTTDLAITSVTAGGTNQGDFPVGTDTCSSATVAAGKTCTVSVTFTPGTTGAESATLTFADNASNSPQTVNLTGTGVAPVPTATTTTLTASAASIPVGTTVTLTATVAPASGTPTPTGTVTFRDGTATLGTGTLSGGKATYSAASLALGSHNLMASYGGDSRNLASASTPLTVSVAPGATTTSLTASATSLAVGSSVTFTAAVTGTSGVPVPTGTVTFMNGATTLGTGTLDGSGTATYSSSSLAAATYSVTAAYGGDANNAASTSSAVSVTVWPGAADFSVSLSASSDSVKAGAPVTVTVSVASTNGFASATNLSCSGLPKNATCTFSPASITPAVSGTATSTLTIKTDTRTTTASLTPLRAGPHSGKGSLPAIAMADVLGSLLLLPLFVSRRRRIRHFLQLLGAVLLLAVLASGAMIGCGGGPTTPAGVYSIQVTGTSGALTQQATLSLTVK